MYLKFSISSFGGHFVRLYITIWAFLVEGLMRNNWVQYLEFGPFV